MKNYKMKKAAALKKTAEIMEILSTESLSWAEVAEYGEILNKIAKRFGLIKEFKENGLI